LLINEKGRNHENRKLVLVPSKPEGGIFHTSLPKILTSQRALQQFLEQLFQQGIKIFSQTLDV